MISLSVCIPTSGLVRAEHCMSLIDFAMYFIQHRVFEDQDQNMVIRHYQSSCISNGRESLAMQSLREGASHVLFIDDDISFGQTAVHTLLQRQVPFICGNYPIRFEGAPFAGITPDFEGRINTTADSPEVEPCGACGFGLALIERKVLEAIPQPWFPIRWAEETKNYTTEDIPFFMAAREAGFIPLIDHVASRTIQHVGSYRYRWDDPREARFTTE